MNEQITDIERTAVTMLAKTSPTNEILKNYVKNICTNPDFSEMPDKFAGRKDFADDMYNHLIHKREDFSGFHQYLLASYTDEAIVKFAGQIAQFRRNGRNQGDQIENIGNTATVITSLAAQIVEFHENIIRAINQSFYEEE